MMVKFFQTTDQERPIAALFFFFRKIFDQTRGRVMSAMVGWPKSYLGSGSKILGTSAITVGESAYVHRFAWIEAVHSFGKQTFCPTIRIGSNFAVSERLHISAINMIEIGEHCLFGSGVYISDHNHGAYKGELQSSPTEPPMKRDLLSFGPVSIGSNVWLGDNVIIVGPVKIGNGVVIGANSVVTRDVPDNAMAAGAPLKILKVFNEELGQWESQKS